MIRLFAEALKTLTAITGELNGVAQHMINATSFVNNFDSFIAVANKVIPALKGIKHPPNPANT